ncbi:trehalose-6-phosphate synthase [Rubrobacter marinus]|uniref:Trehalose-6-phosphate synthase n=1 Tax=Rubrobacter marinus TaxID=2653852 RepID=A0A6G8PUF9_9ACTN|nr:trehalose-6-phosphate synthase [Rubrobacter marinus]QIN77762.1 trehalose-6-phosphate synthase [Rubrobacter marinus]
MVAHGAEGGGGRDGSPIVIVSNRGPVTFSLDGSGDRTYSRGAGGLVTALNAVSRRQEGAVWIASATSDEDARVAAESREEPYEVEDLRVALVEHDADAYDLMYNTLANPLLWFVQHGLYDLPYAPALGDDTRRAWEEGYLPVNENFAAAVERVLEGNPQGGGEPIVLVHDYQLYMVPHFLRERLGEGPFVSLFVHIPWPDPEGWRVLPRYVREGVLQSLLRADVVAFHTDRYARNFVRTAREVLGVEGDEEKGVVRYEGREVWARAYPISIDPGEFEELAASDAVREQEGPVRDLPGKLLLRIDRTDLSKNVLRGFQAYGRMLERHPEMKGEVTFLAGLQPSRGDIPEYAAYAEAIHKAVEEVNEEHGTPSWTPIVLSMEDNFPRSVAAYKAYDVLLVNAVRDGMNLVAKEAAVVNEKNGVLVLSETAGAHEELGEFAVTVNPFDLDEGADAIHAALTMPEEEKKRRAEALKRQVRENTIEEWVEAQLEDITAYRKARG